ncbi:hypothetical protein JCM8547_007039 [Rhodosporidiobolus lusitaniae]
MAELTEQDLVDYLVVHSEWQDAVFVLLRLAEMRERGMLTMKGDESASGVVRSHSWKRCSALVAAVREEETPLRRFVLQLLLHHVARQGHGQALTMATLLKRTWAVEMLTTWHTSGTEEASLSAHVLTLNPNVAAPLLDERFPNRPDPSLLTGTAPLPPPPPGGWFPPDLDLFDVPLDHQFRLVGVPAAVRWLRTMKAISQSPFILAELEPSWLASLKSSAVAASVTGKILGTSDIPVSQKLATPRLPPPQTSTAASTTRFDVRPAPPAQPASIPPPPSDPAFFTSSPIRIHLGHLPVDTTHDEVFRLLQYTKVLFIYLSFSFSYGRQRSAYFSVASRADMLAISSALHSAKLEAALSFSSATSLLPLLTTPTSSCATSLFSAEPGS